MNRVQWIGMRFNADPQKVYEEINSIGEKYTPEEILEKAKDSSTELHKCFEWDDTKAAENWRKQTARVICCSLQVVVEKEEAQPTTYRLIQHDKSEMAYKPVVLTVRNNDEYSRLLNQAKAELKSFKNRYQKIVELQAVIEEIDRVIY